MPSKASVGRLERAAGIEPASLAWKASALDHLISYLERVCI